MIFGSEFGLYAQEFEFAPWNSMVGSTVEHRSLGIGKIIDVTPRKPRKLGPSISIQFKHRLDTFNNDAFKNNYFPSVCASDLIVEQFLEWKSKVAIQEAAQASLNQTRITWQKWLEECHQYILELPTIEETVKRDLENLDSQDLALCLTWSNQDPAENQTTQESWRAFVNSNPVDALRMWSARSAEKAAVAFFRNLHKHTTDVSIHQLNKKSPNWKTHDIEADNIPFDVKNARASFVNSDTYVQHTIPKFKESRQDHTSINILGVLSDYRAWPRIEAREFGSAIILGAVNKQDLVELGQWMNKDFNDILDYRIIQEARLTTYPGWIFEYQTEWYKSRKKTQNLLDHHFKKCPDLDKALEVIPYYVFLYAHHNASPSNIHTSLECELIEKISALHQELGLSRRTLFSWILGTMVRALTTSNGTTVKDTATAIRKILFFNKDPKRYQHPAGLYDPQSYVASLISMFEEISDKIKPELLQEIKFFKLTSPTILKGLLDDGSTWQTIYAHCGGWQSYPVRAPCGANPIHLGNAEICDQCRHLICKNCKFCSFDCSPVRYN